MKKTTADPFNRPGMGLYKIYAADRANLPGIELPSNRLVYIGKSLEFRTRRHFQSGATGSSTLRRSIGAILKSELDLRAVPRGRGQTDRDCINYKFNVACEERLSEWMRSNLEVEFHPVDPGTPERGIEDLEIEMINREHPLLNLWKGNPYKEMIKELRKICADEARRR